MQINPLVAELSVGAGGPGEGGACGQGFETGRAGGSGRMDGWVNRVQGAGSAGIGLKRKGVAE